MTEYYSALSEPLQKIKPTFAYTGSNGRAFVHDVTDSFPPMSDADVFYSDPPWPHGYKIFYERLGREPGKPFAEFAAGVGFELAVIGKPAFMVWGKTAERYAQPHYAVDTKLNGAKARLLMWNVDSATARQMDGLTEELVLERLARRYETVGDFMCGYGRAGRVFVERGKRYVMSDMSPDCIGFIRDNDPQWSPRNHSG